VNDDTCRPSLEVTVRRFKFIQLVADTLTERGEQCLVHKGNSGCRSERVGCWSTWVNAIAAAAVLNAVHLPIERRFPARHPRMIWRGAVVLKDLESHQRRARMTISIIVQVFSTGCTLTNSVMR
jgi:hypothetical protein